MSTYGKGRTLNVNTGVYGKNVSLQGFINVPIYSEIDFRHSLSKSEAETHQRKDKRKDIEHFSIKYIKQIKNIGFLTKINSVYFELHSKGYISIFFILMTYLIYFFIYMLII